MTNFVMVILFFMSSSIYAQKTISTSYFSFKCNCFEVENSYNPLNKSYNYSYQTNDGKSIYMLSIKASTLNSEEFLKAIKDSGTFSYKNTKFKGLDAITADMVIEGQFGKHIGFFRKGKGYSIMIASYSKESLDLLSPKFHDSFTFK
ncbi:MAG: hypothetical protein EOO43_03805 [Flavobacterium sp.]|nr:MAG: hypothetical protein EOO43_03805 [Flavobacterium sp.]